MANNFKQLLASGELVRIFAVGRIVHPVVVDVYGAVGGFHGFWLDQEHCGLTYDQVVLACACARGYGFDTFVRMAMTGYSQATQNLEAGAGGLMGARVQGADDAEQFVRWMKFAPRGERGMNNSGFDGRFCGDTQPQFAARSNRDSFCAIQIETLGALAEANRIAAIDGVDVLFIGPSDLSQELGILGQFDHPKLWDGIAQVAAACKQHGKHWATLALTPQFADRAVELGCKMLSFGVDALALRRGIEATVAGYPKLFGK